MHARNDGFTLIELMIVVAIIALLAAIAIPAYQDYIIRSQVAEGVALSLVGGSKDQITEFYTEYGRLPSSNASLFLPSPISIQGNYVSSVNIGATGLGQIKVTFSSHAPQQANAILDGEFIVISPVPLGGSMEWSCVNALDTVSARYLPQICRP